MRYAYHMAKRRLKPCRPENPYKRVDSRKDGSTAQFLINYGETELAANIALTADCTVYGKDMLLKKGENSIVVPPLSAVMIEKM